MALEMVTMKLIATMMVLATGMETVTVMVLNSDNLSVLMNR